MIQRPSLAKTKTSRAVAQLEDDGGRVTFRATPKTRWGLREAAAAKKKKVKAYLLGLAKADGAAIDPEDLEA